MPLLSSGTPSLNDCRGCRATSLYIFKRPLNLLPLTGRPALGNGQQQLQYLVARHPG